MNLIFCHGCGKKIHITAPTCPQCGAVQTLITITPPSWASLTAFISGIIVFLLILTEPSGKWDADTIAGGIIFGVVPVIFGALSIAKHQEKRWMAITGTVLGIFVILISLGST